MTAQPAIGLHEIHVGDQVEIQDRYGNRAHGIVMISHQGNRTRLGIQALGVTIPFGEHLASGWRRVNQITVLSHQPPLDETW